MFRGKFWNLAHPIEPVTRFHTYFETICIFLHNSLTLPPPPPIPQHTRYVVSVWNGYSICEWLHISQIKPFCAHRRHSKTWLCACVSTEDRCRAREPLWTACRSWMWMLFSYCYLFTLIEYKWMSSYKYSFGHIRFLKSSATDSLHVNK